MAFTLRGTEPTGPTYWAKIQKVLRKHDVLLVADEVINGFGRTGRWFACETYDIKPDMFVLSKQITSSCMPLAALLITDKIYQAVADNTAKIGTFGHGFTASGHPVAMAVALENLKIMEERNVIDHAADVSEEFLAGLHRFATHPLVGETRGAGLIGAIELVSDKVTKAAFAQPGKTGLFLSERCHDHGLIVRPIGDIVAFCPPLVITRPEIREMFARFSRALDDTAAWVAAGSPA